VAKTDGNQHHFARKEVQKNLCTKRYRRKAKSRATGYSGMLIGLRRDKDGRPYIYSSASVACASGAMVPAGVRQRRVGKGGRLPCAEWIPRRGPCAPQTCDAHTTLTSKLFHLVPASPKKQQSTRPRLVRLSNYQCSACGRPAARADQIMSGR